MPEHTNFTIIALQGLFCAIKSFLYGKILMIASKYAYFFIHSHCKSEVCNNINEALSVENTIEESFKVSKCRTFIISVCRFPLHISVQRCSNSTYACVSHIANNKHLASGKELRNDAHIVLQLLVGFFRVSRFT